MLPVDLTNITDVYSEVILPKLRLTKDDLVPYKADSLHWESMDILVKNALKIFMHPDATVAILYDVDVDGIFSGYILEDFLQKQGVKTIHYMNHLKAHGVVKETMHWVRLNKPDYFFVVDAGSGDGKNLNKLAQEGIKCFVIDHHPYDDVVKLEDGVFRANCGDFDYLPKLSGCGTTYRFIEELAKTVGGNVKQYEPYVGITVISDICDFSDKENRYYVQEAYKHYQSNAFLRSFKFFGSYKSFYGFGVIPYLNRLVRIGENDKIFALLRNIDVPQYMSNMLEQRNIVKRKEQAMIHEIEEVGQLFETKSAVLSLRKTKPDLKTVNGLYANKLISKYSKSAMVLYRDPETKIWSGSFRGWNFDNSVLEDWGFEAHGHANACGLVVNNEDLLNFVKNFEIDGLHHNDYLLEIKDANEFSNKTWLKLAQYNEFSGSGMETICIKLDVDVLDAIETTTNRTGKISTYYFDGYEVTDFNTQDNEANSEFIVEPVLNQESVNHFRLLRR